MADRQLAPDTPELRARWSGFAWSKDNAKQAKLIVARYPAGRQRSAVMPLLDLAQRQVGAETNTQGWLPLPVMEYVAAQLDMPVIRVLEVATFYFMYNLVPVEALVFAVAFSILVGGVRSFLSIIDWFERRRSKQKTDNG